MQSAHVLPRPCAACWADLSLLPGIPVKASKSATLNQRIRSELEGRILSGEWAPGFRIPYEHELMEQYACSRMTVNKVLTALAESGMIERRRRAGSFVARQSPHLELVALEIPDIAVQVSAMGHAYGYRLLQRALRSAHADDAGEHTSELQSPGTSRMPSSA